MTNLGKMLGVQDGPLWVQVYDAGKSDPEDYIGELYTLSEILKDNLWIIPSSKYEFLAVPCGVVPYREVLQMHRDIQRDIVDENDRDSMRVGQYAQGANYIIW